MTNLDTPSLTAEKNLWSIYRQCHKLRKNWLNEVVTTISLLILSWYYCITDNDIIILSSSLKEWSLISLEYSGAILGFIVAGYTILLTLSPSELFIKASKITENHSGLSYLKVFQFTFVEVFIYFLLTVVFSIICYALILHSGPLHTFMRIFFLNQNMIYAISLKVSLTILISLTIFTTMKLKSFIYNIYIVSMTVLRFQAEEG